MQTAADDLGEVIRYEATVRYMDTCNLELRDNPDIQKLPCYYDLCNPLTQWVFALQTSGGPVKKIAIWQRWSFLGSPFNITKHLAAFKIARAWRKAIANPHTTVGKRRLLREFEQLDQS